MAFQPMLAHKIEDNRKHVVFPGYAQPKLDGVRCLLTPEGFFSRNGKKILGVPTIEQVAMDTFGDVPLDGELYCHDLSFQEILSSVRRTKNIKEDARIRYHVYDVGFHKPYRERYEFLCRLFWDSDIKVNRCRLNLVPTCVVKNWADISCYMKRLLYQGYEGLMYRHPTATYEFGKRSRYLLKYKKMHTEDFICIGYKEGKGKHKGMLGAIECKGIYGITVWVGSGFNDEQRKAYWALGDSMIGRRLIIKYQEKTDGGVSRFPVFIAWRHYE